MFGISRSGLPAHLLALFLLSMLTAPVKAGCGDGYVIQPERFPDGMLNICSIEEDIGDFEVLINWGGRPEWISDSQIVFLSNQVGDVYRMDLEQNTVTNLTGDFEHAGFTRAYSLKTGDLILVGPKSGDRPPEDPLTTYEEGRFEGYLWVFEPPFNKPPYLLKRKVIEKFSYGTSIRMEPVPAWEGIAVSRESNKIAWSETRVPFVGDNPIETILNYILEPSNILVGEYIDQPGASYLSNTRKLVSKEDVGTGLVFLEPQDFVGEKDEQLTFSAYGPGASGASDAYLYDFNEERVERIVTAAGYDEWEGVSPNYEESFVEVDSDASRFEEPGSVELYLYDFADESATRFSFFQDEYIRSDHFEVANPVFSPSGNQVLFSTGGGEDASDQSPGASIGIVILRDFEDYLDKLPR